MLHVGIDCRFGGTVSGLGSYTRALVTHILRRNDPIQYVLFVRSADEEWIRGLQGAPTTYHLQPTTYAHYSVSEQTLFPLAIRRSGIDLFFSLHFNVPLVCPVPFVATIHDLILHRHSQEASLGKRIAYRAVMRHTIIRAHALIAVSQFVLREIGKTYGMCAARKTTVIPEGVDVRFFLRSAAEQEDALRKYGVHKPFFLYVGNTKEHKNVPMLIAAFRRLRSPDRTLVLVIAGLEACSPETGGGVLRLSSVTDDDLPALYSAAEAFVTASIYEGFCLPIAEARACGCPIIALDIGVMPEVVGKGGVLVETTEEALACAMRSPPPAGALWQRQWGVVAEETVQCLLTVRSSR